MNSNWSTLPTGIYSEKSKNLLEALFAIRSLMKTKCVKKVETIKYPPNLGSGFQFGYHDITGTEACIECTPWEIRQFDENGKEAGMPITSFSKAAYSKAVKTASNMTDYMAKNQDDIDDACHNLLSMHSLDNHLARSSEKLGELMLIYTEDLEYENVKKIISNRLNEVEILIGLLLEKLDPKAAKLEIVISPFIETVKIEGIDTKPFKGGYGIELKATALRFSETVQPEDVKKTEVTVAELKAFSQFVLLLCDPGKLKITSRYAKQFIEKFGKDIYLQFVGQPTVDNPFLLASYALRYKSYCEGWQSKLGELPPL